MDCFGDCDFLFSAWSAAKSLRGSPWFPIAFAISWSVSAPLLAIPISYYGFTSYEDFVMNAYLWLLLGILFRLQAVRENSGVPQC